MINLFSRKLTMILVLAIFVCFTSMFTATAQTITSNQTGTNNGFFYSFWTNGGGSVSMTMGSAGSFTVQWSNCGNFVCGKGWNPGSVRTVTYTGSSSGAQSMGFYGWTKNELIEYYVADMGGGGEGENKGSVTSDGGTYAIWKHQQVNQPSIIGTATFWQYKSCRNSSRVGGTITFSNHVNAWKNAGMNLGSTWDYQILAVEGWGGSSGNANITVSQGGSTTTTSSASTTTTSSASTTTTSSGSTTTSSGSGNIAVRARGTMGGEILEVQIDGNVVDSWTMSTSYQNYYTDGTGTIDVYFTNDDQLQNGMDIQVDYIVYNDVTFQAEDQETNTGVYVNNACGGSYSEMLQCNGYIRFETGSVTPDPTPDPTPDTGTLGDVNSDGTVDIVDALLIAQYYVDLNPENFNPDVADTNCDGTIDIVDALLIAQYYVNLLDSFC